jgi:hypothetical protein
MKKNEVFHIWVTKSTSIWPGRADNSKKPDCNQIGDKMGTKWGQNGDRIGLGLTKWGQNRVRVNFVCRTPRYVTKQSLSHSGNKGTSEHQQASGQESEHFFLEYIFK